MARTLGVRHVGIAARDPAALADFYREILGLTITGGSRADDARVGASAFLSGHPDEENHEIVFFANRAFAHTAFRVESLADLRAIYQDVLARGIPIKRSVNHGCSLAFYFDDPEGNTIEVYWATNVHNHQPYGDPVDLSATDAALIAEVERVASSVGMVMPAGWHARG